MSLITDKGREWLEHNNPYKNIECINHKPIKLPNDMNLYNQDSNIRLGVYEHLVDKGVKNAEILSYFFSYVGIRSMCFPTDVQSSIRDVILGRIGAKYSYCLPSISDEFRMPLISVINDEIGTDIDPAHPDLSYDNYRKILKFDKYDVGFVYDMVTEDTKSVKSYSCIMSHHLDSNYPIDNNKIYGDTWAHDIGHIFVISASPFTPTSDVLDEISEHRLIQYCDARGNKLSNRRIRNNAYLKYIDRQPDNENDAIMASFVVDMNKYGVSWIRKDSIIEVSQSGIYKSVDRPDVSGDEFWDIHSQLEDTGGLLYLWDTWYKYLDRSGFFVSHDENNNDSWWDPVNESWVWADVDVVKTIDGYRIDKESYRQFTGKTPMDFIDKDFVTKNLSYLPVYIANIDGTDVHICSPSKFTPDEFIAKRRVEVYDDQGRVDGYETVSLDLYDLYELVFGHPHPSINESAKLVTKYKSLYKFI